jgi:predicted GNAT superfamily acetyltransferase
MQTLPAIRDARPEDFPAILRLNLESEAFLSPLPLPRLQALHAQAWYHRVAGIEGSVAAFLLALRPGADYDSPNYRWFAERYPEFAYIDRIVVGAASRKAGLANLLYRDLFQRAADAGIRSITCEFDIEPPNEASRRFHERLGFVEVGSQRVGGGRKTVALCELRLDAVSARRPGPG